MGHALSILRDPLGFSRDVRRKHGPLARIAVGTQQVLLLQGAKGVRQILWEKGDLYPKSPLGMAPLEPLLGKSVATMTDENEWQQARRFVLPLFTPTMLRAYFVEAVASISEEVERLDRYAASGEVVDVYHIMHAATFRVLIRTIFREGIDKSEAEELISLFDAATGYINVRSATFGMPIDWAIPSARRGKRALAKLNKRVYRLIAERRAQDEREAVDMLDALIQARMPDGSNLDDKQVRDNCMTMLFGGHETTAGTLTWAWGLIAANPDKRRAMLDEIDGALAGEPPAALNDLPKLRYVENAFAETMRLYPMFGFLFRQASVPDVVEGYQVDAGDLIAFSAYTIQHADDLWADPEAFVPERHQPDAMRQQLKGSYLPFSLGKRACIGERMARMEGVLMLTLISQRFILDLADKLPEASVRMSIKPKGGMKMRVMRR